MLHTILFHVLCVSSLLAAEVTPQDAIRRGEQVRQAWPEELPIDESALAQAGVRRLEGHYVVLYTDVKQTEHVDDLPTWFDRLIPQLCEYFTLPVESFDDFRIEAFLIDDFEKFVPSGAVRQVPALRNGYSLRRRIWLRHQQSDYYRRHLFLHEGVHAFMGHAFGDWGPPWYREGTAELLATHRIGQFGYFPTERRELQHWGRIEVIQEELRHNKKKSVQDIFELKSDDYNANAAYAWSWAFAAFCENHPRYRNAFRSTAWKLGGPAESVRRRFIELLCHDAVHANTSDEEILKRLELDWSDFVTHLEYGYDFKRALIDYAPPAPASQEMATANTVKVRADRGWQASGLRLERDRTYRFSAAGRFQLADKPRPWMSEPGGITLRYCQGKPIGTLLAMLVPDAMGTDDMKKGPEFRSIGLGAIWQPRESGTLFFRINDVASQLSDNQGEAEVQICFMRDQISESAPLNPAGFAACQHDEKDIF